MGEEIDGDLRCSTAAGHRGLTDPRRRFTSAICAPNPPQVLAATCGLDENARDLRVAAGWGQSPSTGAAAAVTGRGCGEFADLANSFTDSGKSNSQSLRISWRASGAAGAVAIATPPGFGRAVFGRETTFSATGRPGRWMPSLFGMQFAEEGAVPRWIPRVVSLSPPDTLIP